LTRAAKISNLQLLISLWDLDAMTKRESGGGNGGWRIDYLFLCYQLLSGEKGKEECISRTQKTREQVRARGHLNTHTTNHKKSKFDDKLVCSVKGRKQEKGMLNRQGNTV